MFAIIMAVIAIALFSAVAVVGVNYIPVDAQTRALLQRDADHGIKSLECAVTRYLDADRGTDGNIIYPGDGVNLAAAVTPAYGFMPADVRKQMTWQIATGTVSGMPAVGICLRPINASTVIQREVLSNLQTQLPVGSAYVGAGCNATANVAGGGALTYWIPLAHVN
jgi:hypothetical protein